MTLQSPRRFSVLGRQGLPFSTRFLVAIATTGTVLILTIVQLLLAYEYSGMVATGILEGGDMEEQILSAHHNRQERKTAGSSTTTIRKWGCNISLAPFVFVHVGKAGGGSIRARIGASALNFTRAKWWQQGGDNSYYPVPEIQENGSLTEYHRGRFCSSNYPLQRPVYHRDFEGVSICNATTPLGHMIGCPHRSKKCMCEGRRCDIVYVGHNMLGSELHWLPPEYLKKWWASFNTQKRGKSTNMIQTRATTSIMSSLDELENARLARRGELKGGALTSVCTSESQQRIIPVNKVDDAVVHDRCLKDHVDRADSIAREWLAASTVRPVIEDWSGLYASLPVARVTVVRDPFPWLVSKFFWHSVDQKYNLTCDDLDTATEGSGRLQQDTLKLVQKRSNEDGRGWLVSFALTYIMYLCGEECWSRIDHGALHSLEELEVQTTNNLRHAFAVVGTIDDVDTFYKMVSTRMSYMDLSLNPEQVGKAHASRKTIESARCKAKFADPEFLSELMKRSPEVAMLSRIYHVALEVNRFHLEELRQCGGEDF